MLVVFQAYVFELDDEYAESDIPTTLIRSKADCPTVEVLYSKLLRQACPHLVFILYFVCTLSQIKL